MKDKIAVVVGTRPGIIKMAPIIRYLYESQIPHFVIHTGQHYSPEMDAVFMRELGIASEVFRVSGSEDKITHGAKTAHMLAGTEEILIAQKPAAVLVCGDANTNLAGGLAARKLNLVLGHVESGLRSRDWRMPEEHNRVILDHISELLFAPTRQCVANLEREKVRGAIHLTGNTVVDALLQHVDIAKNHSDILQRFGLKKKEYLLVTSHREENVDNPDHLRGILLGVKRILLEVRLPVVFPIHPRTRKRIGEAGLAADIEAMTGNGLKAIEPVGYFDFLALLNSSRLVLTDSGGIQEEACILGVPAVTLRDNTERPETLEVESNRLAGTDPEKILQEALRQLNRTQPEWVNPYGDGQAARRIAEITIQALKAGVQLN